MASALEILGELLATPDQQLAGRIAARDAWLDRYGPLVDRDHLPDLTAEEFGVFLSAYNAARYRSQLTADMDRLRAGLARLLDDSTSIEDRLEWLWPTANRPLSGLGKSIATPLLFVHSPDTYGIWSSTAETAMQHLGLWTTFPRGWTTGRQYLLVNRVMTTAAEQLGVDLWTLDALFEVLERKPAAAAAAASAPAAARPRKAATPSTAKPRKVTPRARAAATEAPTFTCSVCFLAKPMAQLSEIDGVCKDCADA